MSSLMARPLGTSSQLAGVGALALTVLMWGFSAVAIKAVSTTGLVTATYRLWISIPALWLSVFSMSFRRRLDTAWLKASLVGGLLFSVHQILYFTSIKLTSVADVTIIGALQPVLVLLLAGPLFGERVTRRAGVWSLVAFFGTVLVMLGSAHAASSTLKGDALAFVNLFAFTAYFLASKRFRQGVAAWDYVVGMTTVSGIVIVALTLATTDDFGSPAPWEWAVLAAIAIFPGTLGHVLSNWAHAHVTAFAASMILLAVPVVATAGAFALLGEPVSPLQLVGAAIVFAAIVTIVRSTRREQGEVMVEGAAFTEAP
jgi:drug/metabolite transporter (DMT)-like permease